MRWNIVLFSVAVLMVALGCGQPKKVFGDKDAVATADDDSLAGNDIQPDEDLFDEDAVNEYNIDIDTFEADTLDVQPDIYVVDEDWVDEDTLVSDTDALVECVSITLPGTLNNDGNNIFFASYTPNTGNTSLPDKFQCSISDPNYQFGVPYALGVGDNANLKTCKYIVYIGEDWSGSTWGRVFLAETGTVTLIEEGGGGCSGNAEYHVEFDNVALREITVDGDGNSTFVPNGACLTLPAHVKMLLTPA